MAKHFTDDHTEHILQAKFGTRAIHAGQHPDPITGAVIPPLSLSTTFKQHSAGEHNVSWTNLFSSIAPEGVTKQLEE
ncbi:hypothetical protein CPC16_002033 [Podila verticillata]|nr:hypothetical protein CPC16_002033 [Podila verticillata]KAI9237923.1 MAG: hypothetical protein BYD32DRAFT_461183 [Podila humilis]